MLSICFVLFDSSEIFLLLKQLAQNLILFQSPAGFLDDVHICATGVEKVIVVHRNARSGSDFKFNLCKSSEAIW